MYKFREWISLVDLQVARFANHLLHKAGNLLTIFLRIFTTLGNNGFIFFVVMVPLLLFFPTREAGFLIFFAMFYGYILTNIVIKNTLTRPRPFVRVNSEYYQWWCEAGKLPESGFSLPSGHTTAAMAFALVMFIFFRKDFSWLFLLIPLLMAFSRVYFMVHYTSDVITGLIVGAICGILALITVYYLKQVTWFIKLLEFKGI